MENWSSRAPSFKAFCRSDQSSCDNLGSQFATLGVFLTVHLHFARVSSLGLHAGVWNSRSGAPRASDSSYTGRDSGKQIDLIEASRTKRPRNKFQWSYLPGKRRTRLFNGRDFLNGELLNSTITWRFLERRFAARREVNESPSEMLGMINTIR